MKAYTEKDKIDKANREKIVELQQKSNLALKRMNETTEQNNPEGQALLPQTQGL